MSYFNKESLENRDSVFLFIVQANCTQQMVDSFYRIKGAVFDLICSNVYSFPRVSSTQLGNSGMS